MPFNAAALLLLGFGFRAEAWCHAPAGSCVGEPRDFRPQGFQEKWALLKSLNGVHQKGVNKDLLRFADWDDDGDLDILVGTYYPETPENMFRILFHERLSNGSFRMHELVKFPDVYLRRYSNDFMYPSLSFQVADWDADGRLDLLLCIRVLAQTNKTSLPEMRVEDSWVTFLSREVLHLNSLESGMVVLNGGESHWFPEQCDMKPVDFDEDGDMDLFLDNRYFERQSTDVTDLMERTNPLSMYYGEVLQIVDYDGDGHLELFVDLTPKNSTEQFLRLDMLRRALDGSFVESTNKPAFENLRIQRSSSYIKKVVHFADWNSDGLPEILMVQIPDTEIHRSFSFRWEWEFRGLYEQMRNQDMVYNAYLSHAIEDIKQDVNGWETLAVLDWNQDGFDDHVLVSDNWLGSTVENSHVVNAAIYKISDSHVQEVPLSQMGFDALSGYFFSHITLVDWDRDGDLDLIVKDRMTKKLLYFEMVSGRFKQIEHPVTGMWVDDLPFFPVDWDLDGDMDLLLGDGRYFEQLADGTLKLWQKNIFTKHIPSSLRCAGKGAFPCVFRFLDCDGDGDQDILRFEKGQYPLVCQHDSTTGTLACGHDLSCLGTNLGKGKSAFQKFGNLVSVDLVNVSDGQLKFMAFHEGRVQAALWTAGGFCIPESPCHGQGSCRKGHLQCTCDQGRELGDCSRCQPGFHGVLQEGQVRVCKKCPTTNGKVCNGRGDCFDDAAARDHEPTIAFMATGNGSCRCKEAYFHGQDTDGRSTCSDGICPAGHEEQDGTCRPCEGGSFSLPGGTCTKCGAGSYSLSASSNCSECEQGMFSEFAGASACEACPAGRYEYNLQSCSDCQTGRYSLGGNGSCEKCPEGSIASNAGSSACEICPGGTMASLAGDECQNCDPGKYSMAGSSSCFTCLPGTMSKVPGASMCDFCQPGTEEWNHVSCSDCQPGFVSSGGNSSCTKCSEGFFAANAGSSACEPCAEGFYSQEGSPRCIACPKGTIPSATGCTKCDAGSFAKGSTCEACPNGTFAPPQSSECYECLPGTYSLNGISCTKCSAGHRAPKPGSIACEPCQGGYYSKEGSSSCFPCGGGEISGTASDSCKSCESNFLPAAPDSTRQSCEVDRKVFLLLIPVFASAGFCFLFLTGFFGQAAVADISAQGQKWVITTTLSHYLLKNSQVTFKGTGNPNLQNFTWRVQTLNAFQLTLSREGSEVGQVDTSMGYLVLKCPGAFMHTGLWRCPLIVWCLFLGAVSATTMSQFAWHLNLLVSGLGALAGSMVFAWRRRQGQRTPLSKRRQQFLKEWPLSCKPCDRGPDRSITAGQLHDFVQFFEAFIKERSMYYVCENIVKPLTKPYRLSFVELVGPVPMEWFVSHFWGMPVRHFNDAIRKHAMSYATDWRGLAYWICTFSNSQWKVTDELGNGAWQESSFYLALSSPSCKGTAMVIDEQVLPLSRIWCLFEVYHTIVLSQNDNFEGLLLCTSTGVLQQGRAGTDVAVKVAERAADLDTRGAEASNDADLRMIHELIERMPGGFGAMNDFVRETICRALEASHHHYEQTFRGLLSTLTSRVAGGESLPTLLPRQRVPVLGRSADFPPLQKGQRNLSEDVYSLP